MISLRTSYMGLQLKTPVVVSACPLSERLDNIIEMEDAGAGAVVLFSLFEEQIRSEMHEHEMILSTTTDQSSEASHYFPALEDFRTRPAQYLELIRRAKERIGIPIIASLNGVTPAGWIEYGQQFEQAGADALEINVFFIPVDPVKTGTEVEELYIDIIRQVKKHLKIPVAIKLNPYFSSMANIAMRLQDAGADALVLFNRFYQPDIDIERMTINMSLDFSLPGEIRLPLLWISALRGKVKTSLAATTGIQTAKEVVKYLLAGADVTMVASSLYRHHIPYLHTIHRELMEWMTRHNFQSVEEFRGLMSQQNIKDPTLYERANYLRILSNKEYSLKPYSSF